jgi:hypothetical protein
MLDGRLINATSYQVDVTAEPYYDSDVGEWQCSIAGIQRIARSNTGCEQGKVPPSSPRLQSVWRLYSSKIALMLPVHGMQRSNTKAQCGRQDDQDDIRVSDLPHRVY